MTSGMLSVSVQAHPSRQFSLDVTFDAPAGITILFGPSGSGKSTLLRLVSGLARPERGMISVGDRVLFSSEAGVDIPARARRVGYVFQQLALFPHMTVADNIGYGLHDRPVAERREAVHRIAESFRIAALLDRSPAQVSGGERQRAALARALVTDPALLLLDEPLSALDHAIQSLIIDDLRRWNEAHRIPVLYVTHAHREVFALGERVIALDHGRVVASGSPHDVLEQPANEALANAAGFENVFEAIVSDRRSAAGTMQCRIALSPIDLEVPLTHAQVGDTVRVAIRAGDILLATQEPRGLSARNILPGRLAGIRREGATMIAVVDAGRPFTVHLTPGAIDGLGLSVGAPLWLVIKTYSCRVVAGQPAPAGG